MKSVLLYAGLIVYVLNYSVGWLLHFRKIRFGKRHHQIIFAANILIPAMLLPLMISDMQKFVLLGISLVMMLILPFGKKGGMYHRVVATLGLLFYIIAFVI